MKKRISITVERCGKSCFYWEHNSGMGHTDDWISCNHPDIGHRELRYSDVKGKCFPDWCPLESVE